MTASKIRVIIDIPTSLHEEWKEASELLPSKDMAELFRKAIRVASVILKAQAAGKQLYIRSGSQKDRHVHLIH